MMGLAQDRLTIGSWKAGGDGKNYAAQRHMLRDREGLECCATSVETRLAGWKSEEDHVIAW